MGEVLAKAGSDLCTARRVPVDLDEAESRGDAPQQSKASPLSVARGVGIVANVSVLGVPGDLVLNDGGAGGVQSFLADLLGELIERVVHGRRRGAAGGDLLPPSGRPAALSLSTSDARILRAKSSRERSSKEWRRQYRGGGRQLGPECRSRVTPRRARRRMALGNPRRASRLRGACGSLRGPGSEMQVVIARAAQAR